MPASPFLRRIPLQPFVPVPVILAAHQRICQLQSKLPPCFCILVMRPEAVPFLPYRRQVFPLWLVPPVRLSHYYPTLLCRHPCQCLQCPSMTAVDPARPNAGHQIKALRLLRFKARPVHLQEGQSSIRYSFLMLPLGISLNKVRREVNPHPFNAVPFCQPDDELALSRGDLKHMRIRPQPHQSDELFEGSRSTVERDGSWQLVSAC